MSTVKFKALGVRVSDGTVSVNEWSGKKLGALAGARAEVTDGVRVHNVAAAALTLMPIFALAKRTKGASAFIVFPDGTVREHKLPGKSEVAAAHRDAIRFNALASAAPAARPALAAGQFSDADHERALKAGQAAMRRQNAAAPSPKICRVP
jgi:hypothetical protein